jgi:hypothetical protein
MSILSTGNMRSAYEVHINPERENAIPKSGLTQDFSCQPCLPKTFKTSNSILSDLQATT